MFALRIHDGTNKDPTVQLPPGDVGGLSFDLADILRTLGTLGTRLTWSCEGLDCFGGRAPELEAAAHAALSMSGAELLTIAESLTQVIDGHFVGSDPITSEAIVDIRAVDSSWWEVRTSVQSIVDAVRVRFRAVEGVDESAA
jgi:hypothetical protein